MVKNTACVGIGCLFATGNDVRRDAILHIGGTRYSTTKDPVEKDWIINVQRRITKRVYDLSRISKAESRKHPHWAQSKADIQGFFGKMDILFVAGISRHVDWFRDRVLRGVQSKPVLVDLLEMYRFFCPEKEVPYTEFSVMQRAPKRGGVALLRLRSGLEKMLHDILSSILGGQQIDDNPRITPVYGFLVQAIAALDAPEDMDAVCRVAAAAEKMRWNSDQAVSPYNAPATFSVVDLTAVVEDLRVPEVNSMSRKEKAVEKRREIKWNHVKGALRNMSHSMDKFEERPQQMEYAAFCTEAMNKSGAYVVEAGTGTGKTLAYLISACEYARLNPSHIVVIATSTKNLMHQIYEKDWRVVQDMPRSLYRGLKVAALRGKQNYLCIGGLRGLYLGSRSRYELGDASARLAWLYLYLLLIKCRGQCEGMPPGLVKRFSNLREFALASNAQEVCHRGTCSIGLGCVYPSTVVRARQANIVLTNHHKVASLDDAIVDRQSVCIIDEADLFPDNLRSADSVTISRYRMQRFLELMLGAKKRRSLVKMLLDGIDRGGNRASGGREIRSYLTRIERACEKLKGLLSSLENVHNRGSFGVRWIDLTLKQRGLLQDAFEAMGESVSEIAECWESIEHKKNVISSGGGDLQRHARELRTIKQVNKVATGLADDLMLMHTDIESANHVFVFQHGNRHWDGMRVPFNLQESEGSGGELVKELSSGCESTVIFTSATLFVDGTLELFAKELFGRENAAQKFKAVKQLKSPFQYDKQVAGAVAAYMPEYSYSKRTEAYKENLAAEMARTIAVLSVAVNGRTLVLFTNSADMREVHKRVRPTLVDHDIELLIQDGTSRAETETFKVREHSVLFGVDRFWTGVDFPGSTLSQVIVVRLPNPALGRPLVRHRRDCFDNNEFWQGWYGPRTRLKLRQGFGRLIRRGDDKGVFILLDTRILGKMRVHARALPVPLKPVPGTAVELAQWAVGSLGFAQELKSRSVDLWNLHARLSPRSSHTTGGKAPWD